MAESEASSESDDAEYIPEGDGGMSESEESVGGEEEEQRGVARGGARGGAKAKGKQKRQPKGRGTRGGIRLEDDGNGVRSDSGSDGDKSEGEESEKNQEEDEGEREREREAQGKAKVDDLWRAFKQDVGSKVTKTSTGESSSVCPHKTQAELKTVKIKKTYDFAGEEVIVEEEVAADSKEARDSPQTQKMASSSSSSSSTSSSTSSSSLLPPSSEPAAVRETAVGGAKRTPLVSPAARALLAGSKRSSGLGSVLQLLGKKPKISTLEKSKLDWEHFKEQEGLEHELAQQRKDGYLGRQEFLQRSDMREFELEREERLKKYRRPHH